MERHPAIARAACYSFNVTWIVGLMVLLGVAAPAQQGGSPTAADGREFESALARILLNAATPRRGGPREVVITERAVAGFLRFQAADSLPPGLTDPVLRMEAGGRLTVTATVDLDAVREQQSPGRLNPLRFLGGRLPVTAVGTVRSARRTLTIDIESAQVGSLPVPATLVAELVRSLHTVGSVSRRDRRQRADSATERHRRRARRVAADGGSPVSDAVCRRR